MRCDEAELFMKNEEELNASAHEKVAKEESDKLVGFNLHLIFSCGSGSTERVNVPHILPS
ncbi:hypothetical protein QQ045_030040 [Rhodiola kirilowii]